MAEITNEKAKYIFKTLEAAGVGITDLSRLTSISRVTLHRWKDGGNINDLLRLNIAYKTATLLEKAVQHDFLPLKDHCSPKQKAAQLRRYVKLMTKKK